MPKLGRRSEFTELDHLRVTALTTSNAPFGTHDTPSYKPRIIGGNMVNVIERPPESDLPRYEKLSLISDKPNNIDPRALTDFYRKYNTPYQDDRKSEQGYYSSDIPCRPEEDPFGKYNNTGKQPYITKRPDSKDISSRYPTLAPIDGNRIKNHQMSTVFEPEAWTGRYRGEENSMTGRKSSSFPGGMQNGFRASPQTYESNNYMPPSTGGRSSQTTDEQFKARLLTMIPKGNFLPENPIVLRREDEMRLLNILTSELYYADPLRLRDVYLDLSNTVDKQLSGYCKYQDLYHTLSRMSFKFPPDLLQIVSAMFVSDHRNQRDVNYEKFLSFVGTALKNKDSVKPPGFKGAQYYSSNTNQGRKHSPVRHRQGSPFFNDGGEAKLLRMVEEQLNEDEFTINFERLINSFQMEDRDMRGTLSADRIKNICFQHRLPIQESLITSLLHRCEDNNRDEQYNWWAFVRLLERVQPVKTGLPIPTSKRPLEYARTLPEPNASWPKAELPPFGSTVPPAWKTNPSVTPRREEVPDVNREIISRMDQELKDLEKNYEEMKARSPRKKEEAPWFKNFMQFADALYRQDEKYEGSLPLNDVAEWTRMYNDAYRLDLPESVISTALNQSTRKGKVDIHHYLSLLGKNN